MMRKLVQFFSGCYSELRRVVWPSRAEIGNSTRVVIISISIFAIVLGLIDLMLLQLIDLLF